MDERLQFVARCRGVDLNHRPLGYEPNVIGSLPIEINDFAIAVARKGHHNHPVFVSNFVPNLLVTCGSWRSPHELSREVPDIPSE